MVGQTLSHYRILEQIGAGGMGVVYLAHDERLERDVALKVLPAGTLADETARKRFRREALTLSKLNHPNIATVFDFDADDDTDFLVTEYITGVTLDAKLASGALPWKEVVGMGRQLAEGLQAAHAKGIVHRDLKPANLRLTSDGRLKILDFGLAQFVQPDGNLAPTMSFTTSQQITGTPPYMAPEQLRGEPADIRSDIWAAGAVLYEMATGRRPFPETIGPLLIDSILNRTTELPSKLNPQVPVGLQNIVMKALEKDPANRYQSARELGSDLDRLTAGVSPLATQPRSRWRYPGAIAATAVVLVGIVLAGYLAIRRNRSSVLPPTGASVATGSRPSVAVLGFKNLSGRSETAWLSTALSEMLTTELAAGEKLLTISGENVARVKSDLSLPETDTLASDTLTRVRKNLGSDFVVLGSYLELGGGGGNQNDDQIRLDLRVQDAIAGQTIAVVSDKGTLAQLDELVTRTGARLREKLGAGKVGATEELAARALRPSNLEASRLYAEGLEKLRHYDALGARDLLMKAVAADPQHAPSQAALSAAWDALGYDANAKESAKQAFDVSANLPREGRLLVEGQYYEISNQPDKAIATYRSLFDASPDNLDYGLKLASAQTGAGRSNDALVTIAGLRKLPVRDDLRIDLAEARAAHSLSDFKREHELATRVAQQGEKQGAKFLVARAKLWQGIALRNLGDAKSGIASCEEARRISSAAGDRFGAALALNNIGNALYDQGDLAGARKIYEEVLKIDREIGNQGGAAGALDNLANVIGDQGDTVTARKLADQALAIYRETGDKAGISATLSNISAALVIKGAFAEAQKAMEESIALSREIGGLSGLAITLNNVAEVRFNLGDTAGAKSDYSESLSTFQKNGEKSKSAYPMVGLGDVLAATGDLSGAKKNYEEALALSREAGDKHEAAMAVSSLGRLLVQQANLAEARKKFEEALALRTEMGEKDAVADSLLDLASVSGEEGRLAEAETSMRKAIADIQTLKLPDREASARARLARNLVEQGKVTEAQKQIAIAKSLTAKSQHKGVGLDVQITGARVQAASGKLADGNAAIAILNRALEEASRFDFVIDQFEARLALGETEVKSGKISAGRERLETLKEDAHAKQYLLIAEKAARAGGSSQSDQSHR
jgi:eukaryotic-like serine/threonine-protein kinase